MSLLCGFAAAAASLVGAATATAAPGSLTYRDCLTTNTAVTTCGAITGAAANGTGTPLNEAASIVVSPDGANAYVAGTTGSAVATFGRNPAGGALAFQGCLSSDSSSAFPCGPTPGASSNGTNAPLGTVRAVAASPDGRNVYAVSGSDAVTQFSRDATTGALTFVSCTTSNTQVTACAPITGANAGGANTGLDAPRSVSVSPDGANVYAASELSDSVAVFNRNATTGALTYQGCITSNTNVACNGISGATAGGSNSALNELWALAASGDGTNVYAAGFSGTVARFTRSAGGGLAYQDCFTTRTAVTSCGPIPGSTATGGDTSLENPTSLTTSPDGRSVYVGSEAGDSLVRFDRSNGSGALGYAGCFTGDLDASACVAVPGATASGTDTPLGNLEGVVATADGANVYAVSYDGLVASFDRDRATGALTFTGCLGANTLVGSCALIGGATANGTNTGLYAPLSIAVSADDLSVYTAASSGDAVARFDREPVPQAALPSNQFSFGKLKRNKRRGTAKLTVEVPGAGALGLAGKGLKRVAREASAAGALKLAVKAKGRRAKRLRERGKGKFKAAVTFTPSGGEPNTKTKRVKLIRRG